MEKDAIALVDYPIGLDSGTGDQLYLDGLQENLPVIIDKHKPDMIIFNAGTDIYNSDDMGRLNITLNGIIEREAFVFKNALDRNIPILMLLSGGYYKHSGLITAKSIHNLFSKFLKRD